MVKLAKLQPTNVQTLDDFFPLSHVVWAAMEKVGHKQLKPKMLAEGSRHLVALRVEGEVDGVPFRQKLTSVVTIGHEQEKTSSVNPQVPELVAYILSKLNSATRDRLLSNIPNEFVENGNQLPKPSLVLVDEAKQMLKQLRETKTVTARGPIRCNYTM
jgi:hypothetical protein